VSTLDDVERLLAWAERTRADLRDHAGSGTSWEFTFPDDGVTQRFTIKGVRSFDRIEADVAALCWWVVSLKDNLRRLHGSQAVDAVAAASPALQAVTAVVNVIHHGPPRFGDKERFLRLQRLEFSFPADAITTTFSAAEITTEPDPATVEITVPVVDGASGEQVGDAIALLDAAMTALEPLLP
jgi:hypothetical protein